MGNSAGDKKKHGKLYDKGPSSNHDNVDSLDSSSCHGPMKTMILSSSSEDGNTSGGVFDGSVMRQDVEGMSLVELMAEHPEGLAVVIIDMQTPELLAGQRGSVSLLAQQQAVLLCAADMGAPIIDISTSQSGNVMTRPELTDVIKGYKHHHCFVKGTQNAFDPASYEKAEAEMLMGLMEGADTVVVMGFDADVCVRGTIFGGSRPKGKSESPEAFARLLEINKERDLLAGQFNREEITLEELNEQSLALQQEKEKIEESNRTYVPGLLSMGKTVITDDAVLAGGRKHPAYGDDRWGC